MNPTEVNILGKTYKIIYCDKPSDVDIEKHEALWGQISYWSREIRIYDNKTSRGDIWHFIFHEIIHGITMGLNIKSIKGNEDDIDLLALALSDVMIRNDWLNQRFGK